jgi:DNA-binding NarL/FixJ family response regulator
VSLFLIIFAPVSEHLTIVIAEPSDVLRRGIGSILMEGSTPPVTISEISHADQLREAIIRVQPDVVIINPVFAAVLTPATIRREFPYTRCVMLSFLPVDVSIATVWDDVISVWDPAQNIRDGILRPHPIASTLKRHAGLLSRREKDVVAAVARGMTNRQIAQELHLSPYTVGTHRRNIASKLGIHTASGLAAWAIVARLVNPRDAGPEDLPI